MHDTTLLLETLMYNKYPNALYEDSMFRLPVFSYQDDLRVRNWLIFYSTETKWNYSAVQSFHAQFCCRNLSLHAQSGEGVRTLLIFGTLMNGKQCHFHFKLLTFLASILCFDVFGILYCFLNVILLYFVFLLDVLIFKYALYVLEKVPI